MNGSEKASRMMTRFDVCGRQDRIYQYQVGLLVHDVVGMYMCGWQ